jgi:hypothetical protein
MTPVPHCGSSHLQERQWICSERHGWCYSYQGHTHHLSITLSFCRSDQQSWQQSIPRGSLEMLCLFHLDKIQDRKMQQSSVAVSILNLDSNTTQTVFLFALPAQALFVNNPVWQKLLDLIILKKICHHPWWDTVHLFIHFARSFCQEFAFMTACDLRQNNFEACWAPFWPGIPCCQPLLASPAWDGATWRVSFCFHVVRLKKES